MHVTLEIPDTFAANLTAVGKDPARIALEALAIEGYRHRQLSESAVRNLLGFENRSEVHTFLADNDVPFNYSIEDKPITPAATATH
jgi:Uncharacterised protein family (UPF0175)